jgi:uncharacterized membrane protein YcfT
MTTQKSRIDWVDYAKGLCIIMVVMMHSTLGVEKAAGAEGWMHDVVVFATPFRMPDFFLIAGLFLSRTIDRDWRTYLDKKVVHFLYFYVLWLTIQFVFKAPGMAAEGGVSHVVEQYLLAFIEPFGTMWFIYILPIFFVLVKLLRNVPWWPVWVAAALLEALRIETGWILVDEFASRFVYFYSGYLFARHVFDFSDWVKANPGRAGLGLGAWALVNGSFAFAGLADFAGVGLILGFAGAFAVVAMAALFATYGVMTPLRYLGEHSIVIYLAFFLPMAASRAVLLKLGIFDLGTVSLIVTASGVICPLILALIVDGRLGDFLFRRPDWAKLRPAGTGRLVPAE